MVILACTTVGKYVPRTCYSKLGALCHLIYGSKQHSQRWNIPLLKLKRLNRYYTSFLVAGGTKCKNLSFTLKRMPRHGWELQTCSKPQWLSTLQIFIRVIWYSLQDLSSQDFNSLASLVLLVSSRWSHLSVGFSLGSVAFGLFFFTG